MSFERNKYQTFFKLNEESFKREIDEGNFGIFRKVR
jgi:hypothetical protein